MTTSQTSIPPVFISDTGPRTCRDRLLRDAAIRAGLKRTRFFVIVTGGAEARSANLRECREAGADGVAVAMVATSPARLPRWMAAAERYAPGAIVVYYDDEPRRRKQPRGGER